MLRDRCAPCTINSIEGDLLDWVAEVIEDEESRSSRTQSVTTRVCSFPSSQPHEQSSPKKRMLAVRSDDSITFAEKTFYMINSCDDQIACWNPAGCGFMVLDVDSFAREVLPEYFKYHTWVAFVSELRLHGFVMRRFHGARCPLPSYEFRHPCFQRGNARLLARIVCRSLGNDASANTNDNEEGEVGEAVGELKYQITALRGEVRQTQELFGKLLASMVSHASSVPPPLMRSQLLARPAACSPSPYTAYFTPPPPATPSGDLTGHLHCVQYC